MISIFYGPILLAVRLGSEKEDNIYGKNWPNTGPLNVPPPLVVRGKKVEEWIKLATEKPYVLSWFRAREKTVCRMPKTG